MKSFLTRYLDGEHEQVWRELVQLAPHEVERADVTEVALETMKRVRCNVEILITRLKQRNYEFGVYCDGSPRRWSAAPLALEPPTDLDRRVTKLETKLGTLPLSIIAFWKIVGSVDLTGRMDGWPDMLDPLIVEPLAAVESEADTLYEDEQHLLISADVYHKDGVSGGPYYRLMLPPDGADAVIRADVREYFVPYLRRAIGMGGFPGFEGLPSMQDDIGDLTKGLTPF